uniref:PH domain-containing protein n=1 Tax=Panagrolaimus sp. ES5 TaxID=591445 RepID=A0AC34GIT2_9BILA
RMSTSSQASARSINARRRPEDVIHQGWLMKRGEHIKNWRARYFVLFKDGALLGFKNVVNDYKDPLNDFTVKDVQYFAAVKFFPFLIACYALVF